MENKIFQPIEVVAKDEGNQQLYDISEYLGWGNKVTINLTVRGADLDEVEKYAWRAIVAMREAQRKRNSEERAKEEELGELMAHDIVEELVNLGIATRRAFGREETRLDSEVVEVPTNLKEEEADGR